VRTGYGTRDTAVVINEVNQFAQWYSKSPELAMHGIFFDEAPHEYVAASVPYMKNLNLYVKNSTTGLQGDRIVSNDAPFFFFWTSWLYGIRNPPLLFQEAQKHNKIEYDAISKIVLANKQPQ
jgi:hypothetical protein